MGYITPIVFVKKVLALCIPGMVAIIPSIFADLHF